jgi:hypothetical protein
VTATATGKLKEKLKAMAEASPMQSALEKAKGKSTEMAVVTTAVKVKATDRQRVLTRVVPADSFASATSKE